MSQKVVAAVSKQPVQLTGLLSWFLLIVKRPLSPNQFAKMLIKRLCESGETGSIEYDDDQFRLCKSDGALF